MTFAISAPSGRGAGGAVVGARSMTTGGTARRCGGSGSKAGTGSSSTGSGTGSGRGWRRGSKRERAMAAHPSRRAGKLLPARSLLAVPVVELLSHPRDQAEADEEDLLRARVVADVPGIAGAVHQERHARVSAAERVGDACPRQTAHDRACADRVLRHHPFLLPEQEVTVTIEHDEDLLLGGVTVRRGVQLSREDLGV